jgi:hypothetical protein
MRLEQHLQESELGSGEKAVTVEPFRQTLASHGLKLEWGFSAIRPVDTVI